MRAGAVDHVVVAAREIAPVDPLHLDHPGAEVRQVPGRQRGGHGLFDRHDGDAVQREAHARVSEASGGVADGLVEDRQAERKLVLGGGQGRGDPEDAAHPGQLHDVHVQA